MANHEFGLGLPYMCGVNDVASRNGLRLRWQHTPDGPRATDSRTVAVPTEAQAIRAADNSGSEATDAPSRPASDNSGRNATGARTTPTATPVATKSVREHRTESLLLSSGRFASISSGLNYTCGVGTDGSVKRRSRDSRRGGPCCRALRDPIRLPFDERSKDEEPTSFQLGKLRT